MRRRHSRAQRYCRRHERVDIARVFDEQPDTEFVDRMVALYREHFGGPSTNATYGAPIVGPTNG
jgi:hypothetical protein